MKNIFRPENRLNLLIILNLIVLIPLLCLGLWSLKDLLPTFHISSEVSSDDYNFSTKDRGYGSKKAMKASESKYDESESMELSEAEAPPADQSYAVAAKGLSKLFLSQANADEPTNANRKLIRNGNLNFQVSDVVKAKESILQKIKDNQALVMNERSEQNGTRIYLTIHVPYQKFEILFEAFASVSEHMDSRNISVEDITARYVDNVETVKNKEKLRERYRAILVQAKKVSDVLEIERELNSVSEQIDSIKGQLKVYDQQIALSTIQLSFYEPEKIEPVQPAPYQFWRKFVGALADGWFATLNFVLWLLSLWPLYVVLAAGGVWFRRRRKK